MRISPVVHRSCIFCLLTSLLLSCGILCASDQDDLKAVVRELEELNEQLQEFQSNRSDLERDMRDQEIKLSSLHREIYNNDRALDLVKAQLESLNENHNSLTRLMLAQEQELRADLIAMYKTGNAEPIKMVLNQEDPAQFSRMLIYYRYLVEARSAKIEAFAETIAQIQHNRDAEQIKSRELSELTSELRKQKTSLDASLARRERLLSRLESRILTAEQRIREHEESARRLEQLISDAAERIARLKPPADYRPFAELKGQYQWPVSGRVSHGYGSLQSGDLRWQGVVFNVVGGTEVRSIHHGRVVFADYIRGYGLLVIVDHEDGYMTLYGHNQSLFVEPGDWVVPGEQLALAGNTGRLSDTGLYFEIRQNGKAVNPAHWCSG